VEELQKIQKDHTKKNVLIKSNLIFVILRLLLIGQYGLKNKREVWRVSYLLARIR